MTQKFIVTATPHQVSPCAPSLHERPDAMTSSGYLRLYDMLGKEMGIYKLNEGINQIEIDCANFVQGVYTYKLILDDSFISAKKLTVIK